MDYEDKRYWLEQAAIELGALKERTYDVQMMDDYQDMISAIDEALDDIFRLEGLLT